MPLPQEKTKELLIAGESETGLLFQVSKANRKAILACGGKVWHHIEFEYPASRKREWMHL
jgi:hypothetical protein